MISEDLSHPGNGESSSGATSGRDEETHIAVGRDSPSNWNNAIDRRSTGTSNLSIDVEAPIDHMLIQTERTDRLANQGGGGRVGKVEQRALLRIIDVIPKAVNGENGTMGLGESRIDKDAAGKNKITATADVVRSGGGEEINFDKVCRICHLGSDRRQEHSDQFASKISMDLIQLGCRCRGELGFAHAQCAGAWFNLKGSRLCEICGDTANNVPSLAQNSRFMEQWNELRFVSGEDGSSNVSTSCWQGKPFCNFLMAFLVLGFVLPWFFRVNLF